MAQKLKNTDRELVLKKVLTESFEPRFLKLRDEMHAHVAAAIAARHPRFIELLENEETKDYVAYSHVYDVRLSDSRKAFYPVFGPRIEEPNCSSFYSRIENASSINLSRAKYLNQPKNYNAVITDENLIAKYEKAWTDYSAARSKLSALLNSYATREKLAEDFPDFAKHVPLSEGRAKLPAGIVTDVLKELAAVGVTASE